MDKKPQIKQASNNKDRQATYTYQLGRFKRACRGGFYFEALMIDYTLLEDRLKSLLYYCGALSNRNSLSVPKKTKNDLKSILIDYDGSDRFSLKTIRGKIQLINSILSWWEHTDSVKDQYDEYQSSLKTLLLDVDVGGIKETLIQMDDWLDYRNEVMHAAMNKNIEALYENLSIRVEEGMEYARFIDSQVKLMKKANTVRKVMKMQNN